MRTLFLLRHAKSSWDDASLADFDRPLNPRGKEDAPRMGKFMRKRGLAPDVILSSPAKRAKKTAKHLRKAGEFAAEILLDDHIYEASPRELLRVAAGIDNAFSSAMIVGHNPGMETFLRDLTQQVETMPTAALAVIDLDIENWADIAEGRGTLKNVFRPKELTSA